MSEETNRELEGPLTEEEVFAALQSVQGGKAPGIDGFPFEFYRVFRAELKEDIMGLRAFWTPLSHRAAGGLCSLCCPRKESCRRSRNGGPSHFCA